MKPLLVGVLAVVAVVAGLGALVAFQQAPAEDFAPPSARVVEVNMTAGRYFYEPGTEQPLEVPLGSDVVLLLRSTDVTHGFAILEYGVNVEVPPGEVVQVRFRADRAGDFTIYCTVFCGSGHPQHKGILHVA